MKLRSYKKLALILCFLSTGVFAQKTSKTFTEKFNVNKNVEVQINASNTDINVSTWNRNEVAVEAYIEIEGISKKEAEEYLKKYNFEALGNKSKVKITSNSSGKYFFKDNMVIFNKSDFQFPEIVIPEIPEMPEINFPDINTIVIPDVDFDNIFMDLDDIDFDFDKYEKDGKKYFFKWKNDAKEITIKSKKEWEKFKKSKDYKKWRAEMKKATAEIKKKMAKVELELSKERKEQIEKSLQKARESIKKIDMTKIQREVAKVQDRIKKQEFKFMFGSDKNETRINGKKVKIKKRLEIKVPKKATFELNTRHCKINMPTSKVSGKVSYGSFKSKGLEEFSNLNISYSPVTIEDLNACTLFLKNVTDASLASVTNSKVSSTSGNLKIVELGNDVVLDSDFGDLEIIKSIPQLKNFIFHLRQSDAKLNFLGLQDKIVIKTENNRSKILSDAKNNSTKIVGSFTASTKDNRIKIVGRYSELVIKK